MQTESLPIKCTEWNAYNDKRIECEIVGAHSDGFKGIYHRTVLSDYPEEGWDRIIGWKAGIPVYYEGSISDVPHKPVGDAFPEYHFCKNCGRDVL